MKIGEKELKRLIKEAAKSEANEILKEINSDPELQDVVAPEAIHDKLLEKIRTHEDAEI